MWKLLAICAGMCFALPVAALQPPSVRDIVGIPSDVVLTEPVAVEALVADRDSPIVQVEFRIDGRSVAVDTDAPWCLVDGRSCGSWDPATLADGEHTISVTATDTDNQTGSLAREFSVFSGRAALQPPAVTSIVGIPSGAVLAEPIAVEALVSDRDSPVAQVEFQIDGRSVAIDTAAPWCLVDGSSCGPWDPGTLADGGHTITVIATDTDNQSGSLSTNFFVATKSSGGSSPGDGYVYTRVPRTNEPGVLSDGTIIAAETVSTNDRLPDVTGQFRSNAPGQLVWLHADGTEEVLYDCMPHNVVGRETCVPLDPQVSPDKTRVVFSVYRGTLQADDRLDVIRVMRGEEAQLHVIDLETRQVTPLPHTPGDFDTGPIWLSNDRIMFTSTELGWFANVWNGPSPEKIPSSMLTTANADGTGRRVVGEYDFRDAMHPRLNPFDGRVYYSSWQADFTRSLILGHTVDNLWQIASVDRRGGDWRAEFGAHSMSLRDLTVTVKALHFLAVLPNQDVCATNYYRGNNLGAGGVLCWTVEPGSEGFGPSEAAREQGVFRPRNVYEGLEGDSSDSDADPGGRVRDPSPVPGGGMVFTWAKGELCHSHGGRKLKELNGTPGCNVGIYKTDALPSGASDGSRAVVVDTPEWHEFMPVPVVSYQDLYGMPEPPIRAVRRPADIGAAPGECLMGGPAIFDRGNLIGQVRRFGGWRGPDDPHPCEVQGCSMHAVDLASEMRAIRFWEVEPWADGFPRSSTFKGWFYKLRRLGDVPLQPDGSFLAELPCDTPLLMAGVDPRGRSLARDRVIMSVKEDEFRTCGGCHNHDRPITDASVPRFTDSMAFGTTPVDLSGTTARKTAWDGPNGVLSDLAAKCGDCHSGATPAGGLDLTSPGTDSDSTWWNLTHGATDGAQPPWVSKYINVFYARESLLYWKAAGLRTDGRTDADRDDDIDFGPVHDRLFTDAELSKLADWIEEGVQGN